MRERLTRTVMSLGVMTAIFGAACSSGGPSIASGSTSTPSVAPSSSPSAAPSVLETIPQPSLAKLNARTRRRLAPEGRRVDLAVPSFSDPADITNPLFPISELTSAVLIGKLHGKPWRAETTLLPDTKVVTWDGRRIEARQSQFVAYLDGRIFEVAVDLYAQADDGSVWYLGEDAFTYTRGRVSDTEGTWRAGVTGPPAMIMPGHPQVGDVYRTENIPGLVFEQVTVKEVGVTVDGPLGAVPGAMVAQELHMDEIRLEDKVFAPGYGEFFSGGGRTFEANALAVPADALAQPTPTELQDISKVALDLFDAARSGDWTAGTTSMSAIEAAWSTFDSGSVPKRLADQMDGAIRAAGRAVGARDRATASHDAVALMLADLDLQLRYRPSGEIDAARFAAWTRQLEVDAAAGDRSAVVGDVATLGWIRDRLAVVPQHVVQEVRASLFVRVEPDGKEALMTHARAKLTPQGRSLLVHRVLELGWSVPMAAEAQGCSAATGYKWLRRFRTEGLQGLHDRSSRPHRSPARLSPRREQAILARREATLEGPHRIAWALGEAPSTVHRVLRRLGAPRLADLDRPTRTIVRYERARPGELVHVDIKKQGRIPAGGGWRIHGRAAADSRHRGDGYDFIHAAVDDRSRLAYAEILPDERKETASGFMTRALRFYRAHGIAVERVLTDNGSCYRSREFARTLTDAGIDHRRTRPYRPQTNGKVERFNLSLKWEWAYARPYDTNDSRTGELARWLHHYNYHRPHMALSGRAPITAVNNVPRKHN